jgi:outer membrane receptor protein involved in Fe transport
VETANPVVTVTPERIQETGALTVGQLMQKLPAMTGGAINPQDHNATSSNTFGRTRLSLRGLGPKRTLILGDGHRVVSEDVNSIPTAMIARVQVLKDGAAVVYGSDAVGGVVNFITKKHYEGAQFSAQYGESSHRDGNRRAYTFTFGHVSDKGSITAGVGYSNQDGIDQAARKFSAQVIQLGTNAAGEPFAFPSGSPTNPFGHVQLPTSGPIHEAYANCSSGRVARNPSASGLNAIKDYHCFVNNGPHNDRYNYAATVELMTPIERQYGFARGSFDLSNNVSAYLDMYITKTRAYYHQAPDTFTTPGVEISKDSYYNPFGITYGGPNGAQYGVRLTSLGDRRADNSETIAQVSTGFKGAFNLFGKNWQWDAGLIYGHDRTNSFNTGFPNLQALYMGPSFLDTTTGEVTCGTPTKPISDCVADFNPFNIQTASSKQALQAANERFLYHESDTQQVLHAGANGGIVNLPAGTIQFAIGADMRRRTFRSTVPTANITNLATGTCPAGNCKIPSSGGFKIKEVFGELFVPILRNQPFAHAVNFTIGERYSHYSTFGSTNNSEFKVEWRPTKNILLRGAVEDVFRAPDLQEEFGNPGNPGPYLNRDPCAGYTGTPVDPACVNVPTDGTFVDQFVSQDLQAGERVEGAAIAGFPIKPESGKSFDFGVVYSPSFVPGLTVSADAWHVYLKNIITIVGLQNLLTLCSNGNTLYCPFIHRHAAGPLQGQLFNSVAPIGNLGRVDVAGDDFSGAYRLTTQSFGVFNFNVKATYLRYYNAQTAPGQPAYHFAGHFMQQGSAAGAACPGVIQCLMPRWRAGSNVTWNFHNLTVTWRTRFIGHFRMGSPAPFQDTHPAGPGINGFFIDYGSYVYNDASVSYKINRVKTVLSFGVNNMFNKKPPLLYGNNTDNADTDALNFDLIGTYYWLRAVVSF